MGRRVRRVPANWEHPHWGGKPLPLYDGLNEDVARFQEDIDREGLLGALTDWEGGPNPNDYMPDFPESERTHYQMYETTSEGTPISPVMKSPEDLAQWLAETGASAFGEMTATYEEWLRVCHGAPAPSLLIEGGVMKSGVAVALDAGPSTPTPKGEQE